MKKLKLLLAVFALLVGGGISVYADDVFKDVTSTYLTNANFEGSYSVHKYPRGDSNKDRAIYLPTGWTINYQSGKEWDMTALNSGDLSWSSFSSVPSLETGETQTYRIRFNNSYKDQRLELSQSATLPKSIYKLEASWYISRTDAGDGYIKIGDTRYNASTASSWQKFSQQFTSTGSAITFLLGAYHSATTEKFYAFDNFKIYWNLTLSLTALIAEANSFIGGEEDSYSTLQSVIDAADAVKGSSSESELETQYTTLAAALDLAKNHRKPWLTAWTTANTNYESATYVYVTGSEKTALKTEIDKSEPSTADAYDSAKTSLETANTTFTAAKANYDALALVNTYITNAGTLSYAVPSKKPSTVVATSSSDAETKTASQYAALRAYYESHALAENVGTAFDLTSRIIDTEDPTNISAWTLTNTTGDSKMRKNSGQSYTDADGTNSHTYFDSNNWGSAFAATFTQALTLPAGDYMLTVKARGENTTTFKVIADDDETDITSIGNTNGVFGNGWNDFSVVFTIDSKKSVTFGIQVETGSSKNWISFGDFRLVKLDATLANSDDFDALSSAISTAEGNTLGFDAGEYTPYRNVDALEKLAIANAINPLVGNLQSEVQEATTNLSGATWTANAALVDNAVYDGTLANAPIQATSENVVLPGWVTKSGNTRQTFKGTDGDGKACLEDANDGVGLFVHPGTYTYGETTGYTMPLKSGVTYVAQAKYCSWNANDNNNFTLTIKKGATQIGTKSFGANKTACTVTGALKEVKLFFTPTESGNHTLNVVTDGNTFMTDFYIERAAPETVTITAAGMATYVSDHDLNYTSVTGLKAYKATVSGTTATFTQVTTVPAGEGVLLEGAAGSYDIPVTTGVTAWEAEDNAFIRGTGAAVDTDAGEGLNNYILSTDNDGNNVGFYYANGETVPTNRAYLQSTAAASRLTLVFNDEATGIKTLGTKVVDAAIYNMNGVRVSKPAKGLYIQNGKKIFIK